ncbi:MAG: acetyl-CoA carboxylase biotin carboxyl carrier protein [Deltaproteobacteria bacterium]|nr:acetyl-CoA carboxylase biotin carboxyl carrier protein [Deltaproteobacteria bacterium]
MALTHNEIISIMKLFRESPFSNLHLEVSDFKLVLSKNGQGMTSLEQAVPAGESPPNEQQIPGRGGMAEQAASPAPAWPEIDRQQLAREGLEVITSPMLGVFYRAPKPGEAPFVEEGSPVAIGDTLCIIEVMKLYTSITADRQGAIKQIYAQDGEMVEYGQPLFLIKPQADSNGK